jgi:hypothetical protein
VLPGRDKGLLDRVLGVLSGAEQAVAVQLQLSPMLFDQLGEGVGVPGPGSGDEISVDGKLPLLARFTWSATGIDASPAGNWASVGLPTFLAAERLPPRQDSSGLAESRRQSMASFVFSYRVPQDHQPGSPESVAAWTDWFARLGAGLADTGHGIIQSAALGNIGADTRLGGYSIVTADDLHAAMELAKGCPALGLGADVEVGQIAVPPAASGASAGRDA